LRLRCSDSSSSSFEQLWSEKVRVGAKELCDFLTKNQQIAAHNETISIEIELVSASDAKSNSPSSRSGRMRYDIECDNAKESET
jgi:hypothetical protein